MGFLSSAIGGFILLLTIIEGIVLLYALSENIVRITLEECLRKATSSSNVLPSEFADTRLSVLGVRGILSWMNAILKTDRVVSPEMYRLLRLCHDTFADFGQAYALLRPRWHMDPSDAFANIEKLRSQTFDSDFPPKRLWDLPSNRVVPFWAVQVEWVDKLEPKNWIAVYHSTSRVDNQLEISSPITGQQWLISIPSDTTLEHIRTELLHIAAEYDVNLVWLDVLCQRQGVPPDEGLREIDVPTIWPIYSHSKLVVLYLNGLSSPPERAQNSSLCDQRVGDHAKDRSYDDILGGETKWALGNITIHSCDNELEESGLEVEYQKNFTGPSYILTSKLADTPLSELGMLGILARINEVLGTDHTPSSAMLLLMLFCMCTFLDFGQAYAVLRTRWHMKPSEALENIEICRKEDQEIRSGALENDIVVKPRCPPRRGWDLWSNRVVPFWVMEIKEICELNDSRGDEYIPWVAFGFKRLAPSGPIGYESGFQRKLDSMYGNWLAISHSWMYKDHRQDVHSPINGYEWPIPIPVDTTLERIRVELLNIGFRHTTNTHIVWLDVLCLRQEGVPLKEGLRRVEWKLDVPTIGSIYTRPQWTVYYFSGLGRAFEEPTDRHDPRHWMNRAWTLQETKKRLIIAGRTPYSPNIPYIIDLNSSPLLIPGTRSGPGEPKWNIAMITSNVNDITKGLMILFLDIEMGGVWTAISSMQHRSATSELDKIAGLVYYLNGFVPPLPAYVVDEDPEDAWDRLIKATRTFIRAQLFFRYPEPGKGRHVWYPTWRQIMDSATPLGQGPDASTCVEFDESTSTYTMKGYWIEGCLVRGLSEVGRSPSRLGKVLVMDGKSTKLDLTIEAYHQTPIPEDHYTLGFARYVEGTPISAMCCTAQCVIARKTEQGLIKKISVVASASWLQDDWELVRSFGESTLKLL